MPNQVLVQKFLPPGNVMELYEEYKATQQMLGGHHVSHLVFYLSMWTNHVPSTQIRKLLEPRVSCEILRIVNLSTAGGNEWQTSYINIYLCIYIYVDTQVFTHVSVYIYIYTLSSHIIWLASPEHWRLGISQVHHFQQGVQGEMVWHIEVPSPLALHILWSVLCLQGSAARPVADFWAKIRMPSRI